MDSLRHPIDARKLRPDTSVPLATTQVEYRPQRRRWPGVLAAALIGGALAALAVSSYYEDHTVGERIDDTILRAGQAVEQGVQGIKNSADDVGITTAVKAALATDPALSAFKIDVTTREGVVSLQGPAPNAQARDRAGVLAAAPAGVVRVDNQLVVDGVPGG